MSGFNMTFIVELDSINDDFDDYPDCDINSINDFFDYADIENIEANGNL